MTDAEPFGPIAALFGQQRQFLVEETGDFLSGFVEMRLGRPAESVRVDVHARGSIEISIVMGTTVPELIIWMS
ncbi:MAG: hypothetical protein ABW213_13205 [Tardiphaga sp.]